MAEPRPHCDLCDGTGRRPLTETERATYALVADEWEPTHAILKRAPRGVEIGAEALSAEIHLPIGVSLVGTAGYSRSAPERRQAGRVRMALPLRVAA